MDLGWVAQVLVERRDAILADWLVAACLQPFHQGHRPAPRDRRGLTCPPDGSGPTSDVPGAEILAHDAFDAASAATPAALIDDLGAVYVRSGVDRGTPPLPVQDRQSAVELYATDTPHLTELNGGQDT